MTRISYKLPLSIIACVLLGSLGSLATVTSIGSWYAGLVKPSFNPPNWIFGPVWTSLFIMMGIAFYLVWTSASEEKGKAMKLFALQFGFNILWSFIFFGLKAPWLGLIEMIMLWVFILVTTFEFYKINRSAGNLMLPYLLWVSFAAVLNGYIAVLN
jgi:translocator protein